MKLSLLTSLVLILNASAFANTMSIDTGIDSIFYYPYDSYVTQFEADCDARLTDIQEVLQGTPVSASKSVTEYPVQCPPRLGPCTPGHLHCDVNLTSEHGTVSISTVQVKADHCDTSFYPKKDANTLFQNAYMGGSLFTDACVIDTIDYSAN